MGMEKPEPFKHAREFRGKSQGNISPHGMAYHQAFFYIKLFYHCGYRLCQEFHGMGCGKALAVPVTGEVDTDHPVVFREFCRELFPYPEVFGESVQKYYGITFACIGKMNFLSLKSNIRHGMDLLRSDDLHNKGIINAEHSCLIRLDAGLGRCAPMRDGQRFAFPMRDGGAAR